MSEDPKPSRPRGRPRVDEPRANVSTWLPAREHDRLIALARDRGISVSRTIRTLVAKATT